MEDTLMIVEQAEEIIKETAEEVVAESTATPFISSSFITIAALVLGFISIVSIVLLFLYCRKLKRTDDDIKGIIFKSLHKRDGRISQAVLELVHGDEELIRRFASLELSNKPLTIKDVEQIVRQELERLSKQAIIDNGINPKHQQSENAPQQNLLLAYASTVNKEKNCFYEVTETPKSDTIFVLELNPEDKNEATFTVYEKVFKKVIQEQGHINTGCVIENPDMNNTTRVITTEPGLTRLMDGKWVIEEKAKVKFE